MERRDYAEIIILIARLPLRDRGRERVLPRGGDGGAALVCVSRHTVIISAISLNIQSDCAAKIPRYYDFKTARRLVNYALDAELYVYYL